MLDSLTNKALSMMAEESYVVGMDKERDIIAALDKIQYACEAVNAAGLIASSLDIYHEVKDIGRLSDPIEGLQDALFLELGRMKYDRIASSRR